MDQFAAFAKRVAAKKRRVEAETIVHQSRVEGGSMSCLSSTPSKVMGSTFLVIKSSFL